MKGRNALVYGAVRRIPAGRVATYGQIAAEIGMKGAARQVGYALYDLPEHTNVPWHRVVNARGEISPRRVFGADMVQRMRLEEEGVRFNSHGRIDLAVARWQPKGRKRIKERTGRL